MIAACPMKTVEVHVFADVQHGYMMRSKKAFNPKIYALSMARTFEILNTLRSIE